VSGQREPVGPVSVPLRPRAGAWHRAARGAPRAPSAPRRPGPARPEQYAPNGLAAPGVNGRWDTQGPQRCVSGANVGIRHANTVFSFCVEVSATLESWPLSRSARRASMCRSGDMIRALDAPKRVNSESWREEDTSDAPVTLTPRAPERGRDDRADPSLPTTGECSLSRRSGSQDVRCCATGGGEGVPHLLFGPYRRAIEASVPVRGAGRVGSSIVDSLGGGLGTVFTEERQRLRIFTGCADSGSTAARYTRNAIPPSRVLARTMRCDSGAPECRNRGGTYEL